MNYVEVECNFCHKKFNKEKKHYNQAIKKGRTYFYCSLSCSHSSSDTTIETCANCSKSIKRTKAIKNRNTSGKYCCSFSCSATIHSRFKDGEQHPNWIDGRKYSSRVNKDKCISCEETRPFLLTIHHKDGNRKNPDISNLEVVCYNCHVLRHLAEVNGKVMYRTKSLTSKELKEKLDLKFN